MLNNHLMNISMYMGIICRTVDTCIMNSEIIFKIPGLQTSCFSTSIYLNATNIVEITELIPICFTLSKNVVLSCCLL